MADSDAATSPAKLRAFEALVASVRLFGSRPAVSLALGAAVALSLLSACCGLGLLTTPWFVCELFGVQLAACTRRAPVRGPAFLRASWLLFWAVTMLGAVFTISLLAAGSPSATTSPRGIDAVLRSGSGPALLGTALAWLLMTPLLYAPLIALDQQASVELALVESARFVVRAGLRASARVSLLMYVVQHLPVALLALLVSLDPAQSALWLLGAAPLACVSIPLGQGMLVSAYVRVSARAAEAPAAPAPLMAAPARRWVRVWGVLIGLPIVALVLLQLSLTRPSRIALGAAPPGEQLIALEPEQRAATIELPPPASALTLRATQHEVSVAASDGGGVGELPLSVADPIRRVRVVRVRDAFAIELLQGERTYLTLIDRTGVRLDDGLGARLRDRSQPWQWLYLGVTLLLTVALSIPVLYDLGRIQHSVPPGAAQARAVRRARRWALLLAPLGLGCLAMAVMALIA